MRDEGFFFLSINEEFFAFANPFLYSVILWPKYILVNASYTPFNLIKMSIDMVALEKFRVKTSF